MSLLTLTSIYGSTTSEEPGALGICWPLITRTFIVVTPRLSSTAFGLNFSVGFLSISGFNTYPHEPFSEKREKL